MPAALVSYVAAALVSYAAAALVSRPHPLLAEGLIERCIQAED
jgi:hypothetical protein